MSFVELDDGVRLWSAVSGQGAPVVLLNGGPGMADYLQPVADLLNEREGLFQVFRYEQRGCGRSDQKPPFTLQQFVADLELLRCAWGIQQLSLVGHSWGVDLGLAYTLTYPKNVRALVGLSGGRVQNDRTWKATYDERKHLEAPPPSAGPHSVEVNKALNDDWKRFCRAPDLLQALSRLPTRALFIYGRDDIRPSWPTEQIAQLLPEAKLEFVENADHYPWVAKPAEVQELMIEFLR